MMSITGEPGDAPVRAGTSVIYMRTGMWLAMAVLAALRQRDATGRGCQISTSLFETRLAWYPCQIVGYLATGAEPQPTGSGLAMLVPYQAFPTADRPLVVAAGNDAMWRKLCSAIEGGDLGAARTSPRTVDRWSSAACRAASCIGSAMPSRTPRPPRSACSRPCRIPRSTTTA